jgi:hypothetical protein
MLVRNPKMIDPYVLLDVADLSLHNLPAEILDIDNLVQWNITLPLKLGLR